MTTPEPTPPAAESAPENQNVKVDPTQNPDGVDWLDIEKYVWSHLAAAEQLLAQMTSSQFMQTDPMLKAALSNHVVGGYQAVATIRLVRLLEKNGVKGLQGLDLGQVVNNLQGQVEGLDGDPPAGG